MRVNLWDKFFKENEDGSIEILRLLRIKNSNCFVMLNANEERIKMTEEQLSKYIKLKPDGYVNVAAVSLGQGVRDVIVSMFRRKDIEDGNATPYCICRQNVFDLFTNELPEAKNVQFIGCSVSIDTCPANVDFKMMMACEELIQNVNVSMYIDDSLDAILYPVSLVNFNDILWENYDIALRSNREMRGYCQSVEKLLVENHFMYDVLKAFNIYKVPFKAVYTEGTKEICIEQRQELEKMLKCEMFHTFMIPYTKEIDLKKIEKDYVLISDSSNVIWVILYDKGDYSDVNYERSVRDVRDQIQDLRSQVKTDVQKIK